MAKRDLGKFGVTDLKQLDQPLPQGIVCTIKLALRPETTASEFNKIKDLEVLRIDVPSRTPLPPAIPSPTDRGRIMTDCPFGFRILGPTLERRRLVDAAAAHRRVLFLRPSG